HPWPGPVRAACVAYHARIVSVIAWSIKGDVKNIFLPPPGAAVLICDIQPLSPRRRSGVVALNDCISAAGIFFSSDDADQFRTNSSRVVVRWQPWLYLRLVAYCFVGFSDCA